MNNFEYLKDSYITAMEVGMLSVDKHSAKYGNELLHHLCTKLVDGSSYNEFDKLSMKQELDVLKNALDIQIEQMYNK